MHNLEHTFNDKEQFYRTISSNHPFPNLKELDFYKKLGDCIRMSSKSCCVSQNLKDSCEKIYYNTIKELSEDEILQIKHICQSNKLKFIFNLSQADQEKGEYNSYEIK